MKLAEGAMNVATTYCKGDSWFEAKESLAQELLRSGKELRDMIARDKLDTIPDLFEELVWVRIESIVSPHWTWKIPKKRTELRTLVNKYFEQILSGEIE